MLPVYMYTLLFTCVWHRHRQETLSAAAVSCEHNASKVRQSNQRSHTHTQATNSLVCPRLTELSVNWLIDSNELGYMMRRKPA